MTMEPPEQVRQWVGEVLGLAPPGDRPGGPLTAWAVLGPALAAVHGATIPVETEPATLLVIAESSEVPAEGTERPSQE